MSTLDICHHATVDGLGKRGALYTFLINLDAGFEGKLAAGDRVMVHDVPVTVKNFEDTYLSFDLPLEQVLGTGLVELEIGSRVMLRAPRKC